MNEHGGKESFVEVRVGFLDTQRIKVDSVVYFCDTIIDSVTAATWPGFKIEWINLDGGFVV